MESIAQRLKKLRKEKEFSVKQVAKLAGIPTTTYREWEYGRAIKGEPYMKLADVLGVSLGELMTGKTPSVNRSFSRIASMRAELDEIEKELRSFC